MAGRGQSTDKSILPHLRLPPERYLPYKDKQFSENKQQFSMAGPQNNCFYCIKNSTYCQIFVPLSLKKEKIEKLITFW